MDNLNRIKKLAGILNESAPAKNAVNEAVGDAAEGIWALCDELDCADHPVFDELVRYLDGGTLYDFVADFRRHNDMNAESVDEAGGYYTKGVWAMIEKDGVEKVMNDLLEFLPADAIDKFVNSMHNVKY